MIAHANESVTGVEIRTIHVLAPGSPATTADPDVTPAAAAAPTLPAHAREKPAGYRRAIASYRAARKTVVTDPGIRAAVERQNREMPREPEELFTDGQAATAELRERAAQQATVPPVDVSRARALKRLTDERAGCVDRAPAPPQLGRTA